LQAVEGKGNRGSPAIEDRVDIGAGANAVVLTDFPDGALAVGVPAVIELRWPPVRP
jgi:serine acetyltransferase